MRKFLFLSVLLLPVAAFAAVQAGFPTEAIWLSKTTPLEGDTVVISTVVYNDSAETLRGTVVFKANDTRIGARDLSLPAGTSQIHSVEWKPKKGTYEIAAEIEGTSAELSRRATPAISITVKDAPQPPSELEKTITNVVQTSAPVIMQTGQNVYSYTEGVRQNGIEYLKKYLAANATGTPSLTGTVAGASTTRPDAQVQGASTAKGKGVLSNLAQTAAAAALYAFENIWLFYPLLAILILGTLYLLARRVRRKPND